MPPTSNHKQCVAKVRNGARKGQRCAQPALDGATCCRHHLKAPRARAMAAMRAEVMRWNDGDPTEDPGQVLIRLLSSSWRRAQRLAAALEDAVDAAGGDLAAALVGDTYTVTPEGKSVKVGEYVRGLAQLEAQERDRAANFAKLALAAGIAQRQIKVIEREAELAETALLAALADAGLDPHQQTAIAGRMAHHLTLLESAG